MRSIVVRLLALVLVFSFLILSSCSEKKSLTVETSEQESTEKIVILPTCSEAEMNIYRAIFQETGLNPVMESTYDSELKAYTDVKLNAYYAAGFKYYVMTEEDYKSIQDYQNKTGIQVMYPVVKRQDRPESEKYKHNANIFYKIDASQPNSIVPVLDQNGDFIPNYWSYAVDAEKPTLAAEYDSIRIEGDSGVNIDGEYCCYVYGRRIQDDLIEVRVFMYAYYGYMVQNRPDAILSEEQFFRIN